MPESRWRADDPNPRGGVRGARGVSAHDDRFVLTGHDDILVLDTSWHLLGRFSHPILSSVHDVIADERGIWATCVRGDSLALMSWDGELLDWWSIGADRRLARKLDIHLVRPFDPQADYRDPRIDLAGWSTVNLNGLGRGSAGLLLCLGRIAERRPHRRFPFRRRPLRPASFAIAELPDDGPVREASASVVLHRRDHAVEAPNHNAGEDGDLLVYNDSNRNVLVLWDRRAGAEVRAIPIPGDPPFARGLTRVGPGKWLVGSQRPLAVHAVDLERGEVVRSYELGGGENESVYAITPLPDRFDEPRPPRSGGPYEFWARAAGSGVTPIPM